MRYINTAVIGAGQAGLAMSRCLTERGVDHVVLERGSYAQRWRTERQPSLRLLTPNWMARLPGWHYQGQDPDGFMTVPELIGFLEDFARSFDAPVQTGTTVLSVRPDRGRYRLHTNSGELISDNVVIATGACDEPSIPGFASRADPRLAQLTPRTFRHPDDLPPGGALVVGASASGVQLASQLRAAGREVMLAVGRHTRLPRSYRGRDIHWWLDRLGVLRRPAGDDALRSPHAISAQLIGSPERRDVDLWTLQHDGVVLAGRLSGIDGRRAHFADDLYDHILDADGRLARLLSRVDDYISSAGVVAAARPTIAVRSVTARPASHGLDLGAAGITSVIWATGYRRRYPWLRVPVLRPDGEIIHRRGVTPAPGLYALGLPLLSRRNSTFIDGVGHDARFLAERITGRVHAHAP